MYSFSRFELFVFLTVIFSLTLNYIGKRLPYWLMVLFYLPGTFFHELMHFVVGGVLGANPSKFSIFPSREGNNITFGYVELQDINSFNAIPTAMAPLLLLFFPYFTYVIFITNQTSPSEAILYAFASALVAQSCIPSTQDFKIAFSHPLGVLAWGGVLVFLVNQLFPELFNTIQLYFSHFKGFLSYFIS